MAFNFSFSFGKLPNYVERDSVGNYWYSMLEGINRLTGKKHANTFANESDKLETILNNPAALKVLKFNADTGAMGKVNLVKDNEEVSDWLYDNYRKSPNPFQTWTAFFWEYFFWIQFGRAFLYLDDKAAYFLVPYNVELTQEQQKRFKGLTFSDYKRNQLKEGSFKYLQADGTKATLELSKLYVINEMEALTGDFLKGPSSLDSLYQVCINSKLALRSKGSNIAFTDKFMVSGQTDDKDISKIPMAEGEKSSIEKAFKGPRQIFATKSRVDVKQMVDNLANLKLDEHYLNDLHIIGNMYGIPKDVLEALGKSATYENQEKALGRHVDYNLLPKGQKLTDVLEVALDQPYLRFSYKHLSFNQVFEKERQEARKLELENLEKAKALGLNERIVSLQLNKLYEQN